MMTMKIPALLATLAILALVVPTPGIAAEPAATTATSSGCTIVLGGGGTVTHDKKFDGVWFEINKQITERVVENLRAAGYRAETLISDAASDQDRFTEVFLNMELHECTKVLQISHILTPPANSSAAGLAWKVDVVHLEAKPEQKGKKRTGSMESDYSKTYRYELTQETMETMSVSGQAEIITRDAIGSGTLPHGN